MVLIRQHRNNYLIDFRVLSITQFRYQMNVEIFNYLVNVSG